MPFDVYVAGRDSLPKDEPTKPVKESATPTTEEKE